MNFDYAMMTLTLGSGDVHDVIQSYSMEWSLLWSSFLLFLGRSLSDSGSAGGSDEGT